MSLKTASSLSKTAQTWREKPANSSDMVRFSGKSFRHGEKIRLHGGQSRARFKARLKSAKNLCFGYRFFVEIRQIHRFFDVFRQKLQILCRNQARLVQALQVGYFSRRDDLLVACSDLLTMRPMQRTSRHAPHAPCAIKRSPLAARRDQQNHRLTCDF